MRAFVKTSVVLMFIVLLLPVSGIAGTSGVWKSTDNTNNFYIQTYSGGECIVIATKDGTEFHVFLDSTVDDGIDVNEYFGRPASLEVVFKDDSHADANLVLSGIPNTYQIERQFEADCGSLWSGSSTESSSGIWKSANPADNFYIQTYSTGSAILIETVDGIRFNVFLDSDVTDGIACQEYFGRSATLSATFSGAGEAVVTLTENSMDRQMDTSRLFVDDCRTVQPTPVFPPVISHAAVYAMNGFGSQWLGFAAEILDDSGAVETGASAWVIGPGSQYIPLRYDPGIGFYNDDDAGFAIVKGDYTFNAEKNGLTAVPLTKRLSADHVIEPPVLHTFGPLVVGQPWMLQWDSVSGAEGYFVFFKYRELKTSLWVNVETVFDRWPNVTSITIPGDLITADADYEIMVVASEDSYIEETSAASVAGLELTTKQAETLHHETVTIDGDF